MTPGPWKVSPDGYRIFNQGPSKDFCLVASTAWNKETRTPTAKANARLIAAAPEMLDALALIAENGCDCPGDNGNVARLALQKARAS